MMWWDSLPVQGRIAVTELPSTLTMRSVGITTLRIVRVSSGNPVHSDVSR